MRVVLDLTPEIDGTVTLVSADVSLDQKTGAPLVPASEIARQRS